MSTYYYLRTNNTPVPMQSEEESGQHLYSVPFTRRLITDLRDKLLNDCHDNELSLTTPFDYASATLHGLGWEDPTREPYVGEKGPKYSAYFVWNTAKFLMTYPWAEFDIYDEYDRLIDDTYMQKHVPPRDLVEGKHP